MGDQSVEVKRQALVEEKRRALVELRLQRPGPGPAAAVEPLTRVSRRGRLPLSFQQEGLWFLHQLNPSSTVYTIPFAWRLQGPLDIEALQTALSTVVARHEALRTRFDSINGQPFQVIDPPPTRFPAPITDLSNRPDPLAAAREHIQTEADRPFDLTTVGLFRAELIRLADRDHILTMAVHHIIADGWSIGILTQELATLYNGTPLPPLTIQPADVAVWQRTSLRLNDQLTYWRNRLDGLPALDLPADRPRPAVRSGSGAGLSADIDAALGAAVADLARAEEVSFLAVLLAAFLVVLARYTGQEDLVVGSVFGGRTRSEVEPLVGYFASTLVLRTSLAGDPDFRALVGRCHDTVLGASAHQDVPFSVVVDALNPAREAGRNPLFQVSFSFQPASWSTGGFALGGVPAEPLPGGGTSQSRFDIAVAVSQRPDQRLQVWVEYATQLFDRSRIGRLVEHLGLVLRQAVDNPDLRLSGFRLMTDAQAHRLIQEWNPSPTLAPLEGRSLLGDLVYEQVKSRPQAPAIRYGDSEITYGELGRRAGRLAWTLRRERAVDAETVVGVLLERGIDLIVAQVGVTLAGGAWLPLDPTHPTERLRYQLQDAGAVTVLTHRTLVDRLPPGTDHLCLDQTPLTGLPDQPPPVRTRPDHLAYLIYTSGSTGRPKGVLVTHRNVTDFLASARDLFALAPTDRVLQFANPTFDVSIFDTFATLGSGALLICAPREQLHNPDHLTTLLAHEHITVAPLPPAVLARIDASAHLPNLRMIIVAGEACGPELVKRWRRPDVEFHNGYGPTEVTVLCTSHRCVASEATVPIGQAMANHRAYVLDATYSPVPIGIPGELYVAGTGVARGYLNHPALTAERFLPDPFTSQPSQRMYRTGDLVRWQDNGTLEFLGRTDRQIKIRGIRIEPGEIEQALLDHPHVLQAVLTTRDENTLAAYVVTDPAEPTDETTLRAHLLDHLPTYLIPTTITQLPALPYTTSG
ncbi:MAG: non-ribosomal peptide synthetase [Micromonosporaceae bacterium]